MKNISVTLAAIFLLVLSLAAQKVPGNDDIDRMLIKGEYQRVLDTARIILASDTLNHEIYYRMGLAYQNLLMDDEAWFCFYKACRLSSGIREYSFQLAKSYYKAEKYVQAEPLFKKLCSEDSLNWVYAHYLTTIYMIRERYDEAITIYKRFIRHDSANYLYVDKMGFALLKKDENQDAINYFTKSLSLNSRDLVAIKNLAYLFTSEQKPDTAVYLLSAGISIDPADMDLYTRRAQIYYYKNNFPEALHDYNILLSSGDSSETNLKRTGIVYCNSMQPAKAIKYLLAAYRKDSLDYETSSYLGQCYYSLKDMKKSIFYYDKVIKILTPIYRQMGRSRMLLAESQKENGMYRQAIANYLVAQTVEPDPNIWMIMANIYDEKLNNRTRAIYYYQRFVDSYKNSKTPFVPEYIESIEKRIEFLKTNPPE